MKSNLTDILSRAGSGAYGEDSEIIGKVFGILANATFDKGTGPFICGTLGKETNGLYEGFLICPMYGADSKATAIYMRAKTNDE